MYLSNLKGLAMVLALSWENIMHSYRLYLLDEREMSLCMHEMISGMRLTLGKEICLFFHAIFIWFLLERNICFTCRKNKICYCMHKTITCMLTLFEIELALLYIVTIMNRSWVENMFLEKNMYSHA